MGLQAPTGVEGLLGGDPQARVSDHTPCRAGRSQEALGDMSRARVDPFVNVCTLLEGAGKS